MEQQEYIMRINMLGQEAEKFESQMQMIDQQMSELDSVKESLSEIKKGVKNTEILANLGKGIFVKSELKDEKLYVNVGKEIMVRKTPEETIKVIEDQLRKLANHKDKITEGIEEIQENMQLLLREMSEKAAKENRQKKQ